jgi:hypothetical protein
MYVGLAFCAVLLVMIGRAMAARDFVSVNGAITVLVFITCGLFIVSLGIVAYEGLYDTPTYSALPLPDSGEEAELPPVSTSHDLIAQARVLAQQRMIDSEIDA